MKFELESWHERYEVMANRRPSQTRLLELMADSLSRSCHDSRSNCDNCRSEPRSSASLRDCKARDSFGPTEAGSSARFLYSSLLQRSPHQRVHPGVDFVELEAQEAANLAMRDAAFEHES